MYRCGKRMFQATGADRGGALDNQLRIPSPPLSIPLLFFLIVDLMFAILGQTVCRIFLCVCVFLNNQTLFKPVTSVLSCSTETFLCTIKYIYYNFPLTSEIGNKAIYILVSEVWFHKRTHLPTMHKALGSLLSTTKKKKKDKHHVKLLYLCYLGLYTHFLLSWSFS